MYELVSVVTLEGEEMTDREGIQFVDNIFPQNELQSGTVTVYTEDPIFAQGIMRGIDNPEYVYKTGYVVTVRPTLDHYPDETAGNNILLESRPIWIDDYCAIMEYSEAPRLL